SLAAQRQPAPDNGLAEALAAIRNAVDEARGASAAALDGLALEDKLAPVRKGARIIREISWRWREIGADGRICDLLDSQVAAIEGACGQIAAIDPRTELSAAFDLIAERIAELGDGDTAPPVEAVAPSPAPVPTAEMSAAAEVAMAEDIVEAAMASPAAQDDEVAATAETADITAAVAETAVATVEAEVITDEAADADDDAILDMIALEMAAEDPYDADDALEMDGGETHVAELAPADPIVVTEEPEPIAAAAEPQAVQPPPEASAEPEPSLGSTLIASGILQRPRMTASDPFAPIRRMSQAEKIAFFS
ncbi:MAG: hypothetical protein WAV72_14050, partial [Bradyrhizobium sp.]